MHLVLVPYDVATRDRVFPGFSVRLSGRRALTYKDSQGELRVDAEAMAGSGITVTVYSGSIPDSPQRGRVQVMDNIHRAFGHAGWVLIPS